MTTGYCDSTICLDLVLVMIMEGEGGRGGGGGGGRENKNVPGGSQDTLKDCKVEILY